MRSDEKRKDFNDSRGSLFAVYPLPESGVALREVAKRDR